MTTKEASDSFNISEKTIRKLCKENKIHGVTKSNGRYNIPDSTTIIITDDNVRAFLYQLLKFKNNSNIILSSAGLDTEEKLHEWYVYLLEQGLIGPCEFCSNFKEMLKKMSLTDQALEIVFGKNNITNLIKLNIEAPINIGLVNNSCSLL